jgi:antitoxin (DNA-binding transcriptional repressor) of toxin-antitoxin stability system
VWQELSTERELVITNNGRPVAILSAVGETDVEESLRAIRQARAMSAVAHIQSQSVERGLDKLSTNDIDAEIAAVRRARRR